MEHDATPDELGPHVPAQGGSGPRRRRGAVAWTWLASLGVHVAVIAVGGSWALRSLAAREAAAARAKPEGIFAVELPAMAEGSLVSDERVDPIGVSPKVSGGPTVARLDTSHDGRGGDPTVDRAATHLSDVDERMQMSQSVLNRLDRDEVQRIRSSARRAAWEDRRSTTHPMELAFLSSGALQRLERRDLAKLDPSRGAKESPSASRVGGLPGVSVETDGSGDGAEAAAGSSREGKRSSSPGLGVRDGVPGTDHERGAAVGHARPDVALTTPSVEAQVKARPRDNVDSEQELTAKVAQLVHASTSGGIVGAAGRGGEPSPGAPGALGFAGAGSHPTPLGDGAGDWFDLSSTDPRIVAYFRRFHAKVDPLWADAFPRSALLELKQGTVILEITIAGNGAAHVSWPPARRSGIDEFDRKCADAVRRASPFDPIPPELGLTTLHIRAPFVATNPIVN